MANIRTVELLRHISQSMEKNSTRLFHKCREGVCKGNNLLIYIKNIGEQMRSNGLRAEAGAKQLQVIFSLATLAMVLTRVKCLTLTRRYSILGRKCRVIGSRSAYADTHRFYQRAQILWTNRCSPGRQDVIQSLLRKSCSENLSNILKSQQQCLR